MTVRKRVQPELHILRFAVEIVKLDFLLSCKVRLQDATEIIPSSPLGDVFCSPDSVPPRVFCRETLSSAQAAAPGTVSAPASLLLVLCSQKTHLTKGHRIWKREQLFQSLRFLGYPKDEG